MLNATPTHFRAWLVWSIAALFVVYNYVQQVVPGAIAPELSRERSNRALNSPLP